MKLRIGSTKQRWFLAILVVALGSGAAIWRWGRQASAEEFITAKVEQGNIRNTVNATGTLQAVTTVQVGSQISGTIQSLSADFNSVVRKGQLVAQLDPAIYQAQVAQARANREAALASLADVQARLASAVAAIETQQAGVSSARSNLAALKSQLEDAQSFYKRQQALADTGIVPQRDMDTARTGLHLAEARYNQASSQLDQEKLREQSAARSGLQQAKAQVLQAKAQVQQTEASLKLAEVNLSHTTIHSPIDGVVVSRNVDIGQTVAASLQAPVLFTIANDLTHMQVIANIDQADIGVINQSDRINFTVDAFPGHNFNGKIRQIRLSPQNVQNVVTYNVVIDVENPEQKLKPGMTANLVFTIAERNDVLKVPNSAFRFLPQGMTQEKVREMARGNAAPEKSSSPAPEKSASPGSPVPGGGKPGGGNAGGGKPGGGNGAERQRGDAMSASGAAPGQPRILWVIGPDHKPQPKKVLIGITDGVSTEIAGGDLKQGDVIIVGQQISGDSKPQTTRPPGFGGAPGGGPGGGGGGRTR